MGDSIDPPGEELSFSTGVLFAQTLMKTVWLNWFHDDASFDIANASLPLSLSNKILAHGVASGQQRLESLPDAKNETAQTI